LSGQWIHPWRLRDLREIKAMDELVRFSVTMEADLLARFDALVARRGTRANRSEAVRDLVRDALVENAVERPDTEIAGTITMVFDHHASDLSDRLNAIQHQFIHEIVSTVHVHLDSCNCLEVVVLRGASARIRAIADTLLGTKGVKHGKLVTTTTGEAVASNEGQEWGHSHAHSLSHSNTHAQVHAHGHGQDAGNDQSRKSNPEQDLDRGAERTAHYRRDP
jgi:CopG family nickel-responsive transcriptional regulator